MEILNNFWYVLTFAQFGDWQGYLVPNILTWSFSDGQMSQLYINAHELTFESD